ncbi:MAG: hypothetical protein PHV82_06135 [Victivallaceae bacterium]|nr:hypothetical protein [Victivallaceae bacterium]
MSNDTKNPDCKCPYSCPRHGECEKCQAYHRRHGERTYCGK